MTPDRPDRYLLLDGRQRHGGLDGWRAATADGLVATPQGLTLAPAALSPPKLADGGVAATACDDTRVEIVDDAVWIDRSAVGATPASPANVERRSTGDAGVALTECRQRVRGVGGTGSGARQFRSPRGIALDGTRLYVADTGNHRVQVFDSVGWVLRHVFGGPTAGTGLGEFDTPTAVAVAGNGDLFVADTGNRRVQKYDCRSRTFTAFDGTTLAARVFQVVYGPRRGDRYVFAPALGRLERWAAGDGIVAILPGRVESADAARERVLVEVDLVGAADALMTFDDTLPASRIDTSEPLTHLVEPTRITMDGESVHVYDAASREVWTFDCVGRLIGRAAGPGVFAAEPSATAATGGTASGTLISERLDSGLDACVWHRIAVELAGPLPPGGAYSVWTFTSDDPDAGPPDVTDMNAWRTGQTNADDFLIRNAPGRYLWFMLRLTGGSPAPVIARLKIYLPRDSYLQYLPAVYQADPAGRDFLERFLSLFQTGFEGIERVIADAWRLFTPDGTPDAFLDWLAGWVGMVYQPGWSVANRRELLHRAPELYRRRGTAGGLALFIRLALGLDVRIVENWRTRRWLTLNGRQTLGVGRLFGEGVAGRLRLDEHSRIGAFRLIDAGCPDQDAFAAAAHGFVVYVDGPLSDDDERRLRQLIDAEKPAHTTYAVRMVGGQLRVGVAASVGLDTGVGPTPRATLGPTSTLNQDAVLAGDPATPDASPPVVGSMWVG